MGSPTWARSQLARLGRQTVGLVERYLSDDAGRDALEEQGGGLGRRYAVVLQGEGVRLTDAVAAFAYFRRGMDEAVRAYAVNRGLSPDATAGLWERVAVLEDQLLVGLTCGVRAGCGGGRLMGPYFPIFVDVRQRPILVIGGGAVGLEKTTVLLRAEASNVTVISPQLAAGLQAQADAGHITHIPRAYAEGDMAGFEMVFIATADRSANATIRAEGRRRGIWVNAADDPANCDYILPSVVRQGPITIAISTGGGSPAMARRVREELSDYFSEDFVPLAELLAEVRADLKARGLLPQISQETWQRAIDGNLRALLAQRRTGQAKALLLARLGAPLAAPPPPDFIDQGVDRGAVVAGGGSGAC